MERNGLPSINRLITRHNEEGRATFSNHVPERLEWSQLPNKAYFSLGYTTEQFPVNFNANKDLEVYQSYLQDAPGLVIPGGTVLRFVDIAPQTMSPMHRTISLDYGVVLEGEVELILDSGESRFMKRGDVAIQRGTSHAWRNNSPTRWTRMMYVLLDSAPVEVEGRTLGEDYGVGMDGVGASKSRKQ